MPESLHYSITPVTAFAQNASLLWCTETREAAIVDPGGDIDTLLEKVDQQGVKLVKILLPIMMDSVQGEAIRILTASARFATPRPLIGRMTVHLQLLVSMQVITGQTA